MVQRDGRRLEFPKGGNRRRINMENIFKPVIPKDHKPKEKLIFPYIFNITGVLTKTYHVEITPMSEEIVFGGISNSYHTRYATRVELDVRGDCPVKSIIYEGDANLEKGDVIKAYIEKYRVHDIRPLFPPTMPIEKYYTERDFNQQEEVHKIEKLNPKNLDEILATFAII